MTQYLIDASSLLNTIKRGLRVLVDASTITLARYECLNAIWKERYLLKVIDDETLEALLKALKTVFVVLPVYDIEGLEEEILQISSKADITIYDASYIAVAKHRGLKLVTDDKELRVKAADYVETLDSRSLR